MYNDMTRNELISAAKDIAANMGKSPSQIDALFANSAIAIWDGIAAQINAGYTFAEWSETTGAGWLVREIAKQVWPNMPTTDEPNWSVTEQNFIDTIDGKNISIERIRDHYVRVGIEMPANASGAYLRFCIRWDAHVWLKDGVRLWESERKNIRRAARRFARVYGYTDHVVWVIENT